MDLIVTLILLTIAFVSTHLYTSKYGTTLFGIFSFYLNIEIFLTGLSYGTTTILAYDPTNPLNIMFFLICVMGSFVCMIGAVTEPQLRPRQ